MADKYREKVTRLIEKMKLSQTPVPGYLIGLSGTDSLLAFLMAYDASNALGMAHRVWGIHYVSAKRQKTTWFEAEIILWLKERCPLAKIDVLTPLGGNYDPQRWADLHLRSLNNLGDEGSAPTTLDPWPEGENFWVVGTINRTERELGTYSEMAKNVSMMLLRNILKSDVLKLCKAQGVPRIALENARLPDCLCGRDDLAAQNIDLIDDILTNRLSVTSENMDLVNTLLAYVNQKKQDYGFKQRTPYDL